MDEVQTTVIAPGLRLLSAWAIVGITTWADAAAAAAFMYTVLLVSEWFWVKFWRPLLANYRKSKEVQREGIDSNFDLGTSGPHGPTG